MSKPLIEALRAQREEWVEVQPGVRVKLRRPGEVEMPAFLKGVRVDEVKACAVDWEGVSQALLLGAAVGSSDPEPFTPELFAEVLLDRAEWAAKLVRKVADMIDAHLARMEAISKNSQDSSASKALPAA